MAAHLFILIAALVTIHKLHTLLAIECTNQCKESSSFRPPFHLLLRQWSVPFYILRAPLALFHLEPLKYTPQFMVCIGRSELIYRYRNETPCTLLVHPRRWSWCTPLLGLPSACSVRYYEPLTFILLQGAQLIENFRECTLPPTV